MLKRRQLISYTALGTAIATITGCLGGNNSNGQSQAVNVGTLANLRSQGQLKGNTPKGPVTVVANGNGGQLSAVNPTCTHNGCQVEWQRGSNKFVCPCHGAEFAADGKVRKGPARRNLPTYAVQVNGDNVLVRS